LVRKVYEWEGNSLGVSDRVPPPWPAMTVAGEAVRCWGREYTFTGLALPKSIPTLQPEPSRGARLRDALAGPVRLVAEKGGRRLAWTHRGSRIVRRKDTEVVIEGAADAPGLKAEVHGTLDYDGFYKVRLRVTPRAGTALDSLRVEVPVPTAASRLFYSVGESMRSNKTFADLAGLPDGVLWNSKAAARNALIKGNFLPVAWLGDEDRGVSWMCDSDRTWVTTFAKPCLDLLRRGGETAFRMHLVNRPAKLTKPIEVTFGLQATPVRPRPKGGSWRKQPWFGWGYFDKPLIYDGCFKGIAKPGDPAPEAWYRTGEARKQNRWWRYFCFNSDRIAESDKLYGQMVKDFGAEWYSESVWVKLQNKAHQDFELWAYKKWHDVASLDGLYYDNAFPAPSTNLLSGSAWIDDAGRLRPGYVVMAYRDFMKRVRSFWTGLGPSPVMKTHMTDTPISGYLGFCDFWLDGENGGYPDARMTNPDFVDRWYNKVGMANLRITLGRQWGTMPMYLYSWGIEPTHAVLGLFDLPNEYKAMGRKPYHDFGLTEPDVAFIPYWDSRGLVKVARGGPDVLTAAWKRPGRVRVLVSNLSGERRGVSLRLQLAALGLPAGAVAVDEKAGGAIPVARAPSDGTAVVKGLRVDRHDYRVVLLAAPGEFRPLDPALGKALEPPREKRIEALCDDFSAVRDVWTRKASPHIGLKWGKVFDSVAGWLRIRTSSYKHALLARPFGRDTGSVQVKIRESTQGYGGEYRPCLCLYW
ncbi:MAG TPA: glycoside hydrolase domain-containing protein, partial [Phycisphaerae bacterium]|nr:glycoside hydrolase domain-containing protein [Phycisphaerae bacterium]